MQTQIEKSGKQINKVQVDVCVSVGLCQALIGELEKEWGSSIHLRAVLLPGLMKP